MSGAMNRLIAASISRLPYFIRGLRFGNAWKAKQNESPACSCPNRFREFVQARTTGRGIWKWDHYFDAYEKHFNRFVGQDVHILEVGIFSGGSLEMWHSYFGEHCHVYGVDIEPACKAYEDEHTRIFIGDQASREFWRETKKHIPQLDIVIDDGGHEPEQQIVTLEEMLPHLKPGGVYMCEDIHGPSNPFHLYVSGLSAQLNGGQIQNEGRDIIATSNAFQASIACITFYPYLYLIETREAQVNQLAARKHGSEWQPFL